ncbi:PTS ascorbate transporter subunit IIC [Paenibacillus sp. GCM10027626]|uniref:PTS ascorbate transporter subunit IIC n=1 Tax=Paenibacillus sp. GCM10027626 TaxID=3273411 RepID=UPI003639B4F3
MNLSDIWDWTFMWQMFRNFSASGSPFVMIVVAVALCGMLLGFLVDLFMKRKRS